MSDDEKDNRTIREKVEEFIMSDNTIEEMEEFGKTHCNEFEDTEENKLVYTEIFNKFTQKFESKLTNFIEDQGSTLQEFSAQCKEELDNEDSQSIALELIMAITDFELFKSTMVDLKDPA